MSNKRERFAQYMAAADSYIKHQMGRRTEGERQAFRQKQIDMYDDELEKCAEKLKRILNSSL